MKLEDAIAQFEAQFAAVDYTTSAAPDIHTFTSAGLPDEGSELGWSGCVCLDKATAVRLWFLSAMEYRRQRPQATTLIWRIKPDVDDSLELHFPTTGEFIDSQTKHPDFMPRKVWRLYSRFAVR